MDDTVINDRPATTAPPLHRETGRGRSVVCIHCNASSSSQWRPLMDRLAPRYRVLAPDTHGAGRGPTWPTDRASQQSAIELAIENVQHWGRALLGETTPLSAFRQLGLPVLLMQGSETPASARAVAALLAAALRRVETITFDGLGHMGPITHPDTVDTAIEDFLRRHASIEGGRRTQSRGER